ncbi:MAG TPA: acylphosphatase [Chloroflexota bacterium]|jgi:acylphosphatase|nr:acylphosphatase [Chloroflexota bacterium]
MHEQKHVRVKVSGFVQGVNFRYYGRLRARELGLRGWIRNSPDGSVEVAAAGSAANVDHFVAWLRHGPPSAMVDRIEVERAAQGEMPDTFQIR